MDDNCYKCGEELKENQDVVFHTYNSKFSCVPCSEKERMQLQEQINDFIEATRKLTRIVCH